MNELGSQSASLDVFALSTTFSCTKIFKSPLYCYY